jgi:hypothetical protein
MSQDTVEWYYERVTDTKASSLLPYIAKFGDLNKPLDFDSKNLTSFFLFPHSWARKSPISFLRECNRVRKSDGLIVVIVPLDMTFTIALGKDEYWRYHPEHLYSFSIENFESAASQNWFWVLMVFISLYLVGRLLIISNSVGSELGSHPNIA